MPWTTTSSSTRFINTVTVTSVVKTTKWKISTVTSPAGKLARVKREDLGKEEEETLSDEEGPEEVEERNEEEYDQADGPEHKSRRNHQLYERHSCAICPEGTPIASSVTVLDSNSAAILWCCPPRSTVRKTVTRTSRTKTKTSFKTSVITRTTTKTVTPAATWSFTGRLFFDPDGNGSFDGNTTLLIKNTPIALIRPYSHRFAKRGGYILAKTVTKMDGTFAFQLTFSLDPGTLVYISLLRALGVPLAWLEVNSAGQLDNGDVAATIRKSTTTVRGASSTRKTTSNLFHKTSTRTFRPTQTLTPVKTRTTGPISTTTPIDPCKVNNNKGCHANATCSTTSGAPVCVCNQFFTGDGVNSCIDVCANGGGCALPNAAGGTGGICVHDAGSPTQTRCDCPAGWNATLCYTHICNVDGSVTSTPLNCDDNDFCTTDSCNSTTGACFHVPFCQ